MHEIITIEADITQGNFPFTKGRAYRVHPGRAASLIRGGVATLGAEEGAEIMTAPDEDGAVYPLTTVEAIPEAVVAPETAPEAPAEKPPAVEPEKPPVQTEGIGGAEALTGAPAPKKGKLAGKATVAPAPAK